MPGPSIADEWEFYQVHFASRRGDDQNAFYMGCMAMLHWCCSDSSDQTIEALAAEIDDFMNADPCMCDACRRKRTKHGKLHTVSNQIRRLRR